MHVVLKAAAAVLAIGMIGAGRVAAAQPRAATMIDMSAGSEFEDYLRILQVAGVAPLYPWSVRSFAPAEISALASADTAGPWRLSSQYKSSVLDVGAATVGSVFNSAYPFGSNDGAIWAGRGVTLAASGGISGGYGPVSFALAPIAFYAQNSEFPLLSNGKAGEQAYAHGSFGHHIDLPQRFGAGSYSRIDPGQSSVRLHTRFLAAGIGTANQWIGPATEYPFLLGNNAPGFPHIFAGTGNPVNLWIVKAHARVMWGKLYQSAYSPVTGGKRFTADETGTDRLTTSATFVVMPRGIRGLELGASRYFHVPNQPGEPSGKFWAKPFKEFFFKNEVAQGDSAGFDNQLVSVFFRWVLPSSGLEVYGERGYEDQFYDLREFLQGLDHEREYMLGLQKTFRRSPRSIDVIKGEIVNYQVPTLGRIRIENAVYLHAPLRQGHTNRGQLLGTNAGVGAGAASTFSWKRYSTSGRTSVSLRRIVRDQAGDYRNLLKVEPGVPMLPGKDTIPANKRTDVIVAVGVERLLFHRYGDFGASVNVMQDYNRNFAENVFNLNVQLTARIRAW